MMFGPPARISNHYSHGMDFSYLDDTCSPAMDEKMLLALREQRRARRAARDAARQQRHQANPLRAALSRIFCGLCNALGDHYDDETLPAARTMRAKDAEWDSLISSAKSSPSTSPRASLLPSAKREQGVRVTVQPVREEVDDVRMQT